MLDPANELLPIPSSPTISSVSSSDLDTESTGSFFHDRSTTLGTLMGVNFPAISAATHPDQSRVTACLTGGTAGNVSGAGRRSKKKKKKTASALVVVSAAERRRRWWKLCSWDDAVEPASLGEFLEIERRYGDGGFYGGDAAELEDVVHPQGNRVGRLLFEDGRVLPPTTSQVDETTTSSSTAAAFLSRFPLTGICKCGAN